MFFLSLYYWHGIFGDTVTNSLGGPCTPELIAIPTVVYVNTVFMLKLDCKVHCVKTGLPDIRVQLPTPSPSVH